MLTNDMGEKTKGESGLRWNKQNVWFILIWVILFIIYIQLKYYF